MAVWRVAYIYNKVGDVPMVPSMAAPVKRKDMRKTFLALLAIVTLLGMVACSDKDDPATPPTKEVDQDDDNTTATLDENYTYRLPVIFHVLYKNAADPKQYVSATRLATLLKHVNHLYQGGLYSTDIGSSENIRVNFVLATHDERGNKLSTPGVEYIKWNGAYPIGPSDFMSNHKEYVKYLWEPNDFINVMVYNFATEAGDNGTTLGISHLPFVLTGVNETDGLTALEATKANITKSNLGFAYCSSINSLYLDYESDRYANEDHNIKSGTIQQLMYDANITLAHELGHYLGLLHVFAEPAEGNTDPCPDTDYCTDTPTYNRTAYLADLTAYINSAKDGSVSLRRLTERTDAAGNSFSATNLMDYSFTYGFQFTAQQKARMRRVLYNSPLIPGPKQRLRAVSRAATPAPAPQGIVDLPIRYMK